MDVRPACSPVRRRSVWPAVLVSLVGHGLFLLLLTCWPAGPQRSAAPPQFIDTCCYLLDGTPAAQRKPVSPPDREGSEEPSEAVVPIAVTPLEAPGAAGTERPAAAPVVQGPGGGMGSAEAGTLATGGPGSVSLFQVTATGRRIVYVIDRSVSMGQWGAWASAKRELLASLAALPDATQVQVIAYNRFAEPLLLRGRPDLAPLDADVREEIARRLAPLRPEGGTDHLPALLRALVLEPDVIFFVTDAADLTPQQVRQVTAANRGRAVLCALELTAGEGGAESGPLLELARLNGGTYRRVPVRD